MNIKEFHPGEYAEDVIHIDDALRNLKDRLKILAMVLSLPVAIPVAIILGAIFYKEEK